MMMASRDLQSRAGGGQLVTASQQQHQLQQTQLSQEHLPMQQQQHLLLPPPRHTSLSLSRMQPPPSRTEYLTSHAMMLRELEEKVKNEMLAAESARIWSRISHEEDEQYPRAPAA